MHTVGTIAGATRNLEGDLLLQIAIDDELLEEVEKLKDIKCVCDIKKYSEKRSLNANAYFWKLVDGLSRVLGVDKDSVYLWQLSRYGVFEDIIIQQESFDMFKRQFRLVEVIDQQKEMLYVRCYFGSSTYNKEEMRHLIDGTVSDAKEQNIDTWTPEEVERVLQMWEGER